MPDFLSFINEILWGSVMIYLLLGAGVWFTWRTKYIQFRYIRQFSKSLKKSLQPQPGGLTSFQALCMSLAARVGSGNMAGVALAIAAGGPGAVFWMWISALLGMASSFAECSLAQLYKERDSRGHFRGGPAWYMARGSACAGWACCSLFFSCWPTVLFLTPSRPTPLPMPWSMRFVYLMSSLAACLRP